jgi:hypothetical protein
MGGSTADTPTTPESVRVSDADRDHAVNELRNEFVEGRLSHETFMYRMQTAMDARNRGQLANLFTDLPSQRSWRARWLARIRTAIGSGPADALPAAAGSGPVRSGPGTRLAGPGVAPAPLFFPPGRGDRFTIGRTRDCDLCLADPSVSRRHAELIRDAEGWLLNDLGSRNGTRLNGWLVRETVAVRAGDRLELGSAIFVLQDQPGTPTWERDRTG